jgi:hypothetical protein
MPDSVYLLAAVVALAAIFSVRLYDRVSFLIPIYIQFVQDQTPLFTAIAIVPYTLVVALAAVLEFHDADNTRFDE